jgi:hypothetical protein
MRLTTLCQLCACLLIVAGLAFTPAEAEPNELIGGDANDPGDAKDEEDDPVVQALDFAANLPPRDELLINGLRYLMRPDYEQAIFEDSRNELAEVPFSSFERPGADYSSVLEKLRYLAILQSGIPVATPLRAAHTRAYLSSAIPEHDETLAPYAIDLLLAQALLKDADPGVANELRDRAQRVLAETEARRRFTDPNRNEGFMGNLMWRGVITRVGAMLELSHRDSILQDDFRSLTRLWGSNSGFADSRVSPLNEIERQIAGLTAVAMYDQAPASLLSSARRRQLDSIITNVPKFVEYLHDHLRGDLYRDVRGAFVLSWPASMTPVGRDATQWRNAGIMLWSYNLVGDNRNNSGAIRAHHGLLPFIGLSDEDTTYGHQEALTTALSVIGLSGGLLSREMGPLATRDLGEVGRAMHAFSVIHADRGDNQGGPFHVRVGRAIDRGCDWLLAQQNDDGSFGGTSQGYLGNTAIALMALLYGGHHRDTEPVQRAFSWMTAQIVRRTDRHSRVDTYSAGLVLMAYQKYYEREQAETRVSAPKSPREYESARRAMLRKLKSEHRQAIEHVVSDMDGARASTGWHYGRGGTASRPDNSNTQYAMLGYKAACLLGMDIPDSLFRDEARRLLDTYIAASNMGKVDYEYSDSNRAGGRTTATSRGKVQPGGWSYMPASTALCGRSMQMTAAGIGTLAICLDELDVRGRLPRELAHEITKAIRGAEVYMMSKYPDEDAMQRQAFDRAGDGWGIYYNLYAVERACVLAHIRLLDGEVDWYRIGAEALVDNQPEDGGWSSQVVELPRRNFQRANVVNVAKAILFLRRAAMPVITEHRRRTREKDPLDDTPQPPEAPSGPITGR